MSKLLIDEPPLQVLPTLAVRIGLCEAIIIQQIHYWLQRTKPLDDGHFWVYNTVNEWQKQFPFWHGNTIFRHLQTLRDSGVLIAEQKSANAFDKTLYYRIDYAKLGVESITPKLGNRKHQIKVITINTETTRDYSVSFDDFWKAYPKKIARGNAEKAWKKIKPDETLVAEIITAIAKQKPSWTDPKFIPNPASWLNAKQWLDGVEIKVGKVLNYWEKGYVA